jgi:hypothetical protein
VGKSNEVKGREEVNEVKEREMKERFEANHEGEPVRLLPGACLATIMGNDTILFTECQSQS